MANGKPVLCEKPLAANADEAMQCVADARALGVSLVEANHWRHHPIATRLQRLRDTEELGRIEQIEVQFHYSVPPEQAHNIRLHYDLGGGALLDAGSYGVNLLRMMLGEPVAIGSAKAVTSKPQVDVAMDATLEFPSGALGRLIVTNASDVGLNVFAKIKGEKGSAMIRNPFLPHRGCTITFDRLNDHWIEEIDPTPSYIFQAGIFVDIVRSGVTRLESAEDAVGNLHVIDTIYRAANLQPRGLAVSEQDFG